MLPITQRIETYELNFVDKKEIYNLSDIRFLRDKPVHAITLTFGFGFLNLYSLSDKVLDNLSLMKNCYLTIIDTTGKTIFSEMPLSEFYEANYYIPFMKVRIDLNKSYIRVKDISAIDINKSLLLTFLFNEKSYTFSKNYNIKCENVIVEVNDITKGKFYFPDIESLRGKKIKAIQLTNNSISGRVNPNGLTEVLLEATFSSYLNLVQKNNKIISNCPLSLFTFSVNRDERKLIFDDIEIDWNLSYIQQGHIPYNTINTCYFFNVYYL